MEIVHIHNHRNKHKPIQRNAKSGGLCGGKSEFKMAMKIIFICSDPKWCNGEQYTSECPIHSSIETAALYAMENEYIIQAIDIQDLSDIEDVTQQVAEALTTYRFENCESTPQYSLNVDMHTLICKLEAAVAEDRAIERDTQTMYAHGAF